MIYQLCYQENAYCTKKNLTCHEGFVISVEWSRIAFSEYWVDDGTRSNCTPTSGTCYEEVDEPTINCSNSNSCQLDSCGKNIHTNINCLGNEATNVLQINYTCIEGKCHLLIIDSRYGFMRFRNKQQLMTFMTYRISLKPSITEFSLSLSCVCVYVCLCVCVWARARALIW